MKRRTQTSFEEYRARTPSPGHGGRRPGAGRPRSQLSRVHHVRRPPVAGYHPAHVTLRVRPGVPSLRRRRFVRAFRTSLHRACDRGEFRVVHYSIQRNHVHLIVEAAGKAALGRGMKAVGSRLARAVHRVYRRSGPVLDGRYHLGVLRTPREVRSALAYVLLNARRHWYQRYRKAPPVRLDEASSGRWFLGWRRPPPGLEVGRTPEVAEPHSWLLSTGWRQRGLIDPGEVPGIGQLRPAS